MICPAGVLSGGFCPGEDLSGGFCPGWVSRGGLCPGGVCPGGVLSGYLEDPNSRTPKRPKEDPLGKKVPLIPLQKSSSHQRGPHQARGTPITQ